MLVWNQTIWKFPVESPTAAVFRPANQEFPIHLVFQLDDLLAGIPVGKRLSADRAVGYGAALNKNTIFVIVGDRVS